MIRSIAINRLILFRQVLPVDVYFWAKAVLLAGVGIQLARLLWAAFTPVGPFGDWRPREARVLPAQAQAALLAVVDPFYRQAGPAAAAQQFPAIDLKLYGTREERGGGGSAIIGPPDGEQASYAVGDEVAPGVKLAAVFFDFVLLDSGGQQRKLFIDGAEGGDDTGPAAPAPPGQQPAATAPAAPGTTAGALRRAVRLAPRNAGGRVTGILVQPAGDLAAFAAAGFRPGDVIVSVNGVRISSPQDVAQFQSSLVAGARLSLGVERGAATVPIALNLAGQ